MDKATRKAIFDAIGKSTIPEEMKVMYLMADATQTLVEHVYSRVSGVFQRHGYKTGENELLTGLNDYCKAVRQAGYHFYNRVEPQISSATWGIGRDDENPNAGGGYVQAYDRFHEDANEVVRLVMLYIDRTARNNEGFAKVFKTLRQLSSNGIFKDEDISYFKMKHL